MKVRLRAVGECPQLAGSGPAAFGRGNVEADMQLNIRTINIALATPNDLQVDSQFKFDRRSHRKFAGVPPR
jgi:hypothetical protein